MNVELDFCFVYELSEKLCTEFEKKLNLKKQQPTTPFFRSWLG